MFGLSARGRGVAPQNHRRLFAFVSLVLSALPLLSGCRPLTAWSPDGKLLALDPRGVLFTFDLGTKKFQQRSRGPLQVMNPTWSPGGQKLAYYKAATKGDNVNALSLVQLDLQSGRESPLVARIPFEVPKPKPDELNLNLGNRKEFVRLMAQTAWSPDEKQLVYAGLAGQNPSLWVANADGANGRSILPKDRFGISPSWSPNSQAIAYFGFPPTEEQPAPPDAQGPRSPDLDVVNADGSGHRILWDSQKRGKIAAFGPNPRWSGDGKSLLVFIDGEAKPMEPFASSAVLWSVPVDGGEPTMITSVAAPSMFITGDPSHGMAFFLAPENPMEESPMVAMLTPPFKEVRSLTRLDPATMGFKKGQEVDEPFPVPDLSPDGKTIAVAVLPKGGPGSLLLMSTSGGKPTRYLIPGSTPAAAAPGTKRAAPKKPARPGKKK